jgi:hypothetical protein
MAERVGFELTVGLVAHSSRRRRFFPRVVAELGLHYIAVERALVVEQGRRDRARAVRAVVAAGASIYSGP